MDKIVNNAIGLAGRARDVWGMLVEYFVTGRRKRQEPINDRASLQRFLQTRSNYVVQMSLYGYLRTRAGVRYPEMFQDDTFIDMLNVAKWQIWLACLSDLSVYAGGLLVQRVPGSTKKTAKLIQRVVAETLEETGVPPDAGPAFLEHAEAVRKRLATTDWSAVTDDEEPFSESPDALVQWAPIIETLKELDAHIVRNSVRFRWQQVRRDLRGYLDAEAILNQPA